MGAEMCIRDSHWTFGVSHPPSARPDICVQCYDACYPFLGADMWLCSNLAVAPATASGSVLPGGPAQSSACAHAGDGTPTPHGTKRHLLCRHGLDPEVCGICRARPRAAADGDPVVNTAGSRTAHSGGHSGFTAKYRLPMNAIAPDKRARIAPLRFNTKHASVRLPLSGSG